LTFIGTSFPSQGDKKVRLAALVAAFFGVSRNCALRKKGTSLVNFQRCPFFFAALFLRRVPLSSPFLFARGASSSLFLPFIRNAFFPFSVPARLSSPAASEGISEKKSSLRHNIAVERRQVSRGPEARDGGLLRLFKFALM
jgi:hypothetical protein